MVRPPRRGQRGALLAPALLLGAALAGCLTDSQEPAGLEAAAAVLRDQCVGAASGRCSMVDGRLVLSGLDLVPREGGRNVYFPQTTPPVGLLVDGLTVPLVVEAVELTGFWTGIALRDTCPDCTIEIRDARIEALHTAVQVGKTAPVRGDLAILRSSIVSLDTPPAARLTPNDVRGVGLDAGLHGRGGHEGDLTLQDVHLEAMGRALGPAVVHNLTEGAAFEGRNVTVVGYENSIFVYGEPGRLVRLAGVSIDCRDEAFYTTETGARALGVDGRAAVVVEDVVVRDWGWPEDCYPQCGEAIRIGGMGQGRTNATGEAVLRNLTMLHNSPKGMAITQRERVVLENVLMEDGLVGIHEISSDELQMRNVTIRGFGWQAAFAEVDRLEGDRLVFEGNGLRGAQDGYIAGGGFFVNGYGSPLVIHNSSFVGNEPTALTSAKALMDASSNWWGSPLGPSRQVRLPGFGDPTDGLMVTVPHLTAPP